MRVTASAAIPADFAIRFDPFLHVPLLSQGGVFLVRNFPLISVEHDVRTTDYNFRWMIQF